MKTITIITLLISVLFLTSCGTSNQPLTEAQQAESYNMSLEEFREMKDAAARMNMSIEDHMKMTDIDHNTMQNNTNNTTTNPIIEEDDMMMHH